MPRRAKKPKPKLDVEQRAYTIAEFCQAYRVSRAELYEMWKAGTGPRRTRKGIKGVIITIEAALEWERRKCSDDAVNTLPAA